MMTQHAVKCPELMEYSYPWGPAFTAYSTSRFEFDQVRALYLSVEFEYKYFESMKLRPPQVWLNKNPPENGEEGPLPRHELKYSTMEVVPGERFLLSGLVYLDEALPFHDVVTVRPQVQGGWFNDVERYAPIYRYRFECVTGPGSGAASQASSALSRQRPGEPR